MYICIYNTKSTPHLQSITVLQYHNIHLTLYNNTILIKYFIPIMYIIGGCALLARNEMRKVAQLNYNRVYDNQPNA